MLHLVLNKLGRLWFLICDLSQVLNWGSDIVIMQLMSSISPARRKFFDVSELNFFFPSEIGSKISSFFGGSKEDENKESKVEVSGC